MRINKEFWFVNFGMLLIALDIHLFKTPNHFALGGTSGISILVCIIFQMHLSEF